MSRALVLSAVLASLATTSAPAADQFRVIYPKQDRAAVAALSQPARPDHSGPLREILDDVSKVHHIPILLDEQSLTDEGISVDDVANVVAENSTLATLLDKLLEPYGLKYIIEDEVLKITTETHAERSKVVRAYEVSGLLDEETTIDAVGKTVSSIANAEWSAHADSPPVTSPPLVVPFKNRLIIIASPRGHEQVLRALEMMSAVEE